MKNNLITQEKGDSGLFNVISDLHKKGYKIALPMSTYLPYDIIGISPEGKLAKISIKYRKLEKTGCVVLPIRMVSHNSKGWNVKITDLNEIDGYALYCPESNECYYIPTSKLRDIKSNLWIRITNKEHLSPERFNNSVDFLNPIVLFNKVAEA